MERDPCEKLMKYISSFKNSIKDIKILDLTASKIVSLAIDYLRDSQYYLEKNDCITGLVTISYAEGLLDALRMINAIEMSWKKAGETVVFVAGSFDIIHPGHIEFLKWASSLGNKLVVAIARDSNYRRFKGFNPIFNEDERLKIVEAIRYVYKAIIGSDRDIFESVANVKPSIVALGYDQPDPEHILNGLKVHGLEDVSIVKMPERIEGYSSSLIKARVCREWCQHAH